VDEALDRAMIVGYNIVVLILQYWR
jgi:hypothetical protein